MAPPPHIAADLTVRQVAAAWPASASLLERYPSARYAGSWSLQELGAFARDHGLDEPTFLGELARAAGVPVAATSKSLSGPSPVPLVFIAIGIGLTLGAGWGVTLLLRIAWAINYDAAPGASIHVHGVAQLWGWMALFIFAVATHLLRQNTRRPAPPWLEWSAAGLIVLGLAAFFAGLLEPLRRAIPTIDIIASAALACAAVVFGMAVIWSLSGRSASQRLHGFIFLIAWLWIWAGTDLWLRVHYRDAAVLPDPARRLLIILPVLGVATNAIYGFGVRLIPGLLNIGRLRPRFFTVSMLAHNVGLCLLLAPLPMFETSGFRTLAAALMLVGALLYLAGMDFLRTKPARPIYGVDVRGHALIRVAFFWLLAGLSMVLIEQCVADLPHAFTGAWRHALTVGFITTMILGVGQRIVPVFIKQPLASTRLMLVSGGLIIVGNAARVGLELATIGGGSWTFRLMGLTGVLELTALILFAINLAVTVRRRHRIYAIGQPLTPDTRVREAINAQPALQQQLRDVGVTMFDATPFIAPSLTFGALALASGRSPQGLLADLRNDPCDSICSGAMSDGAPAA